MECHLGSGNCYRRGSATKRTIASAARSAIVAGVITVSGCDIFHRWDALVYVNKFDLAKSIDLGTFDTLEECRAAALDKIAELKIGELGTYICGENCMVQSGFSPLRMCARTSR